MARDAVHTDFLVVEQDVVAYFQHGHGSVEVGAHQVGQAELVRGRAHEQGTPFGQSGDGFAGEVVVGHQAAAVGVAFQRVVVELAVDVVHVDGQSHQFLVFLEEVDPRVEVGGAVVAVDHRHGASVGRGHDVDGLVGTRKLLLQHNHGERRRSGGDVARALLHGVGGYHARACVAFGRTERDTGFQPSRGVELAGTFGRQASGVLTGHQDAGQDVAQLPAVARSNQLLELLHHRSGIVLRFGVDGQHAGGVADAQHALARQLPVDVSGQRRQEVNGGHMGLAVQNGLVEVRDAPAQGDVVNKELGQPGGGGTGVRVAPRAEGYEDVLLLVEGHVAVHHGADADGGEGLYLRAVLLLHVGLQVSVAVLQAAPHGVEAVGPEAVDELVFPRVAALCDGLVFLVDEYRLDAGGAELDAEDGASGFYGGFGI